MPLKYDRSRIRALMLIALALGGLWLGCERVPTGSDLPVTKERLVARRLTDIKRDVSWRFSESQVVIDNDGQPLPTDIADTMQLDSTQPVSLIEAHWVLDEQAGVLTLSQLQIDGVENTSVLGLPITPAGQIRVNLAGRQYNMFADAAAVAP